MTDLQHNTPSPLKLGLSLGIALVLMLTLALVMIFLYLPSRPRPVNAAIVEERLEKIETLNAAQHELISTYAWLDEAHTQVRIPINRAMELTLKSLQSRTVSPQAVPNP
jgi:hypothetical protein